MDFVSFIVGTAIIWGVILIFVNPLTKVLAIARLRSTSSVGEHGPIDTTSIPERYYMFMGSLIFAVIGLLIGVATGIFFVGFSWKKRDLPGMGTFVMSSIAGSCINIGYFLEISGTLLALTILLTAVTGIAVASQSANVLKWKMGAPVPPPPIVRPNVPVTSPVNTGFSGTTVPSATYPNAAVENRLPRIPRFCGQCGAEHKIDAAFCGECGAKIVN